MEVIVNKKMDSKSEQGPNQWFVTAIQFSYFIVCQGGGERNDPERLSNE